MRPFNKKFSVFDPNLQIGADTKKTAEGDNNIQKAEFEQVIRSSGQTPGASISISSLTQTAGLATAVTASPHGFITGQWVDIFGVDADPYQLLVYNGIQQATVTAPDTFTFPILPGTPSPATGTIGVYHSQIDKAIANYTASQFAWKEAAGSAADVYVLERVGIPDLTAPAAYYEGSLFQFEVVNTNTGGSTIEIPVLGVKDIKVILGGDTYPGALQAGRAVTLRYDGTNLVLIDGFPPNYASYYQSLADVGVAAASFQLYPLLLAINIQTAGNPIRLSFNATYYFTADSTSSLGVDEIANPLTPVLPSAAVGAGEINRHNPGVAMEVVLPWPAGAYEFRVIYTLADTTVQGINLKGVSLFAWEMK